MTLNMVITDLQNSRSFFSGVSFTSKTQGSLSTSIAESEIKAVNQCLKAEALALRGMLNLMGFSQDATIIEEDN